MTWYADLAECDYFPRCHPSFLRAVGWLEPGNVYTRWTVDPHVLAKLTDLLRHPWQPCHPMGFHHCDLCPRELSEHKVGVNNLFIPGDGFLYVCPELIPHYINDHQYSPATEFCEAVMACPPMNSRTYLRVVEPLWTRETTKYGKMSWCRRRFFQERRTSRSSTKLWRSGDLPPLNQVRSGGRISG